MSGHRPWPPNLDNARASMNPPDLTQYAQSPEVQWERTPVCEPRPWIPYNRNIGQQFRRYVIEPVVDSPVNVEAPRRIDVSAPAILYGLSGTAFRTDNVDLPAGRDPLDTFLVRFQHSNGDRIDTGFGPGKSMLGDGAYPALLGGPAWIFDRGSSIQVYLIPLVVNLFISVTCWTIELRGPANYSPLG